MSFDFSLTTFSPKGKLLQIEYALKAVSSLEVATAAFGSDDKALQQSSEAALALEKLADTARLRFTREVAQLLDDFNKTRAEILADLLHDKLDRHARDAQRYQDALVNLPFDGLPPRRPTARLLGSS